MKNLFIFSVLIMFNFTAYAENRQVEAFDQGSCWLDRSKQGLVEVASFNDGTSFKFSREHLDTVQDIMEQNMPEFPIEGSQIKSSVHCSSQGARVVLNIQNQGKKVCLWLKKSKQNMSLAYIGGALEKDVSSCDGYKLGKVLIGLKEDETLRNEVLQALEDGDVSSMVKEVKRGSFGLLTIELKRSAHFKESEFKKLMEKYDGVAYVDFSWHSHGVGEFVSFDLLPSRKSQK